MEIKVLGPGCAKCKTTFGIIQRVVNDNNIDATVTKVEDIMEIMNYNIISTPTVVDGEVKIKGHVPTESEIRKMLGL